jgi:SAM-dependent methyltransferase
LPSRGGQALDLGCGTGRHATVLADRFDEVVAVDICRPMLDLARAKRRRSNVVHVEPDPRVITPDRDGPFEVVLSAFALHHVEDLDAVLKHIRSLVAPGGRAILIDIVGPRGRAGRWRRYLDAVRCFPADWLDRGPRQAAEVYGLRTHPAWLAHLDTDRYLSAEEFDRRCGAVFAHARFARLQRRVRVMWWREGMDSDQAAQAHAFDRQPTASGAGSEAPNRPGLTGRGDRIELHRGALGCVGTRALGGHPRNNSSQNRRTED